MIVKITPFRVVKKGCMPQNKKATGHKAVAYRTIKYRMLF
jgi:hypothetical protein